MRIVSINAALTVGPQQIALNVDEELSPEFIEQIDYGNLKFSGEGKTLIVHLPQESEPFSATSVKSLNSMLQLANDALALKAAKRDRMLQNIAQGTGLPLA